MRKATNLPSTQSSGDPNKRRDEIAKREFPSRQNQLGFPGVQVSWRTARPGFPCGRPARKRVARPDRHVDWISTQRSWNVRPFSDLLA
jgi:hypothetical protein